MGDMIQFLPRRSRVFYTDTLGNVLFMDSIVTSNFENYHFDPNAKLWTDTAPSEYTEPEKG